MVKRRMWLVVAALGSLAVGAIAYAIAVGQGTPLIIGGGQIGHSFSGTGWFGKYRGVTVDNQDPMGHGRILVSVPQVLGNVTSWAVPCVPCTVFHSRDPFVPEVGQSVWVEFEGGDVGHPIWSGCLAPPE